MKFIGTGDTAIDKDGAAELRERMISWRDALLGDGQMEAVVILSHVVAFMANAIGTIWPETIPVAAQSAIDKLRSDLAWRGPNKKSMALCTLTRAQAEMLLLHVTGEQS